MLTDMARFTINLIALLYSGDNCYVYNLKVDVVLSGSRSFSVVNVLDFRTLSTIVMSGLRWGTENRS